MEVRLISLGLCEKLDLKKKSWNSHSIQVENYFKNKIFHFNLNSEKDEDYLATGRESRGYPKHKFNIKAKGGYFNPTIVETQFYDNEIEISNECIIENRQPLFFVLLIPYPSLRFFNDHHKYGTSDWAFNPKPFSKMRFESNFTREKRFSNLSLKTDLGGEVKISNVLNKFDTINNFFDNNNYPLFIEDHDELITLINDLDCFYNNLHNLNLNLKNLTKIIIPFFELNSNEVHELRNSKSDNLPF